MFRSGGEGVCDKQTSKSGYDLSDHVTCLVAFFWLINSIQLFSFFLKQPCDGPVLLRIGTMVIFILVI